MNELLEIKNLSVSFGEGKELLTVIDNLDFSVQKGDTIGLVGESGSGKSVTSLSIMRLLPEHSSKVTGEIIFQGENLLKYNLKKMQEIRGNRIAMIFQEPMTSLNPIHTCGKQVMESLLLHMNISKKEAKEKTLKLLEQCGIPDPVHRFNEYPHQMSGGMRQRIMIAIALACNPNLLIADEPTTALDVTIQAQILDLMKEIKKKSDMSIMLITHDLGVVLDFCDRVIIMYAGQIVESASVREVFESPIHPYTKGLIAAMPKLSDTKKQLDAIPGMVPDLKEMPKGCRFNPRCKYALDCCKEEMPELKEINGRLVRCFLAKDV